MSYIIAQLLSDQAGYCPVTRAFGLVDVRPEKITSALEKDVLRRSMAAWGKTINMTVARLCITVVEESDIDEAREIARVRFSDTLDAMMANFTGFERLELTEIGYYRDLRSGVINEITPGINTNVFGPSMRIVPDSLPPIELGQHILQMEGTSDIARAFLRSSHWRRQSTLEDNPALAILEKWISLEAMAKLGIQDDIVPKVMLGMGFVTGSFGRLISAPYLKKLQGHKDHEKWKNWTNKTLVEIRDFRNDAVHSGFRSQELSREDAQRYDRLMTLAVPRMLKIAHAALQQGVQTVEEMWEYAPIIYEGLGELNIRDNHGNVIHLLAR